MVMDWRFAMAGFGGTLPACPACGSGDLDAVSDGELTNFLCRACLRCWHVELGWVQRVTPSTCPGCAHRGACLSAEAQRA